ncbi:beta- N-acetylglucosaminidase [Lachnospiraceae bacterium JC7]|nr:beta- N-acetylglucosaminidase [Lachnospiraceae bacterium JC7]
MKKMNYRRKLHKAGAFLSALSIFMSAPATSFLNSAAVAHAESTTVISGSNVNVRSGAGTDSSIVTSLGNNTQVTVMNQATGTDGNVWYQISFAGGSGYVRSDFVKYQATYTTDANFEDYLTQQGFPESYKPGLRQLHAQYPNWVFTAEQTGLDWSYVIQSELQGTNSLIEKTVRSSWKSTDPGKFDWTTSTWPGFDGATWVAASQGILEYYMDPRNFLDENYIFQFTAHKFDPAKQTLDGLKSMVQGTFLEGAVTVDSTSNLYQAALQSMYANAGNTAAADTASAATDVTGPTVADSISDLVNSGMSSDEVVIAYEAPSAGGDSSHYVSAVVPVSGTADGSSTDSTYIVDATGTGTDASAGLVSGPTVAAADSAAATDASAAAANGTAATDNSAYLQALAQGSGTMTVTYSDIIMEAAQISQVNPYVLASMIIQEQGTKGTSGSISGATGYYNFFNVGAYAAGGMTAVERGLWYASQEGSYNRPWNSIERAIIGGALFYAQNYVNAGQNTLYLKKFNVQGSNMFKHQYMTNTQGAAEEGKKLGKAYTQTMRNDAIEFFIPVYTNMPETACPMPTKDGNPNNKLAALSVDGFALTPGFNMDTESYTLIVDPSVSYVNVSAAAIHSGAAIQGAGQVALAQASNIIPVTVTAENGDQRTYTITINKAGGGMYSSDQAAAASADGSAAGVSVQIESSDASVSVSSETIEANLVEVGVGPL